MTLRMKQNNGWHSKILNHDHGTRRLVRRGTAHGENGKRMGSHNTVES